MCNCTVYVCIIDINPICVVMLLTLKEDNTTSTFNLCCLFSVICMIIKSDVMHRSVHLYTIIICADGGSRYVSRYTIGYS